MTLQPDLRPDAMKLNRSLEETLALLPTETRERILLWFASAEDPPEPVTEPLKRSVEDLSHTNALACYEALSAIPVEERVRFSIINEFGNKAALKVVSKPSYFQQFLDLCLGKLV
jgi:hypothetical protein